jgi:KUP system potassium uptake protein
LWAAAAVIVPFLFIDLVFFGANLLKILQGGWVPLLIAALVVAVMLTWRRGARVLRLKTRRLEMPLAELVQRLEKKPPTRVQGTAVFLTADPESAPTALLHSLKHNKVLHERNAVLTVITEDTPRVPGERRVQIEPLGDSFSRIVIRCGFMETPDVQKAMEQARRQGWHYEPMATSFVLSRRNLRRDPKSSLPNWQDDLFLLLARNADDASSYFRLPTDRVIEIGTQVTV